MKKQVSLIFAILFVAAMALSACAPQTTATTAPATAAPTVAPTAAATAVVATTAPALSGTISISGAFALYPMMTVWADEYSKIHPDVKFDISAGGAGKGMTDALSGAVDIGMVSRTVTAAETAKGAYTIPVTKDAVFGVISTKNPVYADIMAKGISKDMFKKIFITGEVTTWGEVVGKPEVTDKIHVYTRSDSCGAKDMWAAFMGGVADDIKGIGVNGDPGLLQAVITDPLGIGYNNLGYAYDITTGKPTEGAITIPIDVNANGVADTDEVADTLAKAVELISSGKYPAPPARLENLVTNGKPSGLVSDFIHWVLTDGQQFVAQAGFVKLTDDQINQSLELLK